MVEYIERLRVVKPLTISIVGAGGKTTLLIELAYLLPGLVISTTSTKLASETALLFERQAHLDGELPDFSVFGGPQVKNILVTDHSFEKDGIKKLEGLTLDQLVTLNRICYQNNATLLIEADGARHRQLKAPAGWEPVIPDFSDLVIYVIGAEGIGKPLNEENVFRSEIFASLTESRLEEPVQPEMIARYLQHPLGGQKGIPENANKFLLIAQNNFESSTSDIYQNLANQMKGYFDAVFIASFGLGRQCHQIKSHRLL